MTVGMAQGNRLKMIVGRLANPAKVVLDLLGLRSGG